MGISQPLLYRGNAEIILTLGELLCRRFNSTEGTGTSSLAGWVEIFDEEEVGVAGIGDGGGGSLDMVIE